MEDQIDGTKGGYDLGVDRIGDLSHQHVQTHRIGGCATFVLMGKSKSLVSSPYMNIIIKQSYANPNDISIPRRNLVTIVIHCETNNEDACVLSKG